MTLPAQGSRTLTIDGLVYRWVSRRAWVHAPESGASFIRHRLRVEPEASPGALLRVELDSTQLFPEGGSRLKYADFLSVTPAVVALAIRAALAAGWPQAPRTLHWADGAKRFEAELRRAAAAAGQAKPGAHSPD